MADTFDAQRLKWRDMLTGGVNCDTNDLNLRFVLLSIAKDTNYFHTNFWNNLPPAANSAQNTIAFNRIYGMALAYAACGSAVKGDAGLAADIINALDWMYANRYNETTSESGNWWDWEIGSPMALNDTCVLMYDVLSSSRLNNYMNAVNHFSPVPTREAANLVWKARVVGVRGVLVKDASKLGLTRDALSQVFRYTTSGDGFYTDGSFIQHTDHPYTAGYGASLLRSVSLLLPWLNAFPNQSWNVVDPQQTNVLNWVFDSYEPLVYRGAAMDMVRGREITRPLSTDHAIGHDMVESIYRLALWTNSARLKSMVKYWAQADTSSYFVNTSSLPMIAPIKQLLADPNVVSRGDLVGNYQFPHMDRVVHLRPGWGLGIAMSSSRIANYESLNNEDLHGWFTGDGMTYLYNGDVIQFTDNFWPTVDPYRLPGTTVERQTRANAANESYLSDANWVGGAKLGLHGAAGMQLHPASSTLSARKSWFMFDNEVVCLGAAMSSSQNRTIETIVENRRLSVDGNNLLTVNGGVKPATLGWTETATLPTRSWAHLQGSALGEDIGYFFPQAATLNALREARTGAYNDIDTKFGLTNRSTRNYLTLWFNHGVNLTNGTYAYVLLPGQTAAQVSQYAASPEISVLTNSARAQGVKQSTLGITAVNFWEDGATTVGDVTAFQKCSVLVQNDGTFLEVGVADPTQANASSVVLEIGFAATDPNLITLDPGVTVQQSSPKIRLSVNVAKAGGKTFHAKLFIGAPGHFPPAVALVSPMDGARFAAPATLTLNATEVSSGVVTNLTFFNGLTGLAQRSGPPYTLSLPDLSPGHYTFTAVATDNGGLASTSAPVTISVLDAPTANGTNIAFPVTPFLDVDLWTLASDAGTPGSNLLFRVGTATSGNATLLGDGHTARFIPAADSASSASFTYTVTDMGGDPRLLLSYGFEPPDAASDGIVTDLSGNGRNGRLSALGNGSFSYTNLSPFPGFNTTSLRLTENGSTGAARLTRDLSELNLSDHSWTFGGWFLRAATNTEDFIFYLGSGSGHGGSGDELEVYGSTDGSLRLGHYDILGAPDVQLTSARLPVQWHHVALTFERANLYSGILRLYLDGALVEPSTNVAWALNLSQPLVLGGHSSTTVNLSRYFNGWLDDLVLFTNALSAEEVSRLAAGTVAHFGGITAGNNVNVTRNTAPTLPPTADVTTRPGVSLSITNAATDPDVPPQVLTYSLSTNSAAPAGAAIDPASGVFTWRPAVAQADTTNSITVVVTDNGAPSLSASQTFSVLVQPLTAPLLSAAGWTNGVLQISIDGDTGPDYTIQASEDLTTWTTLVTTNSPALPFLWADESATNYQWRFYRVLPGP